MKQSTMRKRFLVALMVMVLVLSSFGGIFVFADDGQITTITIFHTNDIHGRVDEGAYDGMGFGKLATIIRELREANPKALLLDAGDTVHGLPIATMVKGESIIEIMNLMGYDAMTPGNHDFNYGQERLVELDEIAQFPILAANVVKEDGTSLLQSYIIKEVDGLKVAIFGLATPETLFKSHPKGVEGLTFQDPVEAAAAMVEELKDKADIIIALAHLGMDGESVDTSIKVAENVEGIDLIVDGHSHTTLEEGMVVGNTLIVSTGDYGINLGVVEITIKDGAVIEKTARLITKEEAAEVVMDPEVEALVNSIKADQALILSEVIGKATVKLVGEREVVRQGESNLGNLLTDVFLEVTGAEIAMTNGGGIRGSINEGDITKGDIIRTFPFGNVIQTVQIKGSSVKAMLEHGTDAYPALKGAFPHVAGISYTIDLNKSVGDRVVDIMINGQPLDLDRQYVLATNDFLAAGGDGYTMLKEAVALNEFIAMDEALVAYIQEREVIAPAIEGRINVVQEEVVEEVIEEENTIIYTVVPGDWLSRIAARFGTTWQILQEINQIKNPHLIFPGQEIIIPVQ